MPTKPLSPAELDVIKAVWAQAGEPQPPTHTGLDIAGPGSQSHGPTCPRCIWTERFAERCLAAPTHVAALLDEVERLTQELIELKAWKTGALLFGCKCDPPGSGEEWCVGACWTKQERGEARDEVERLRGAIVAFGRQMRD